MIDFTSKPNWENAPEWANYLAMDNDCDWWWFEKKPVIDENYWDNQLGRFSFASTYNPFWKGTVEQKPGNK